MAALVESANHWDHNQCRARFLPCHPACPPGFGGGTGVRPVLRTARSGGTLANLVPLLDRRDMRFMHPDALGRDAATSTA